MTEASSSLGGINPSANSCWTKIIESKWTDVVLITGFVALLIIAIAASAGAFSTIGTTNAAYLSYGMYVGAAILFVAEIVKKVIFCLKQTDDTVHSNQTDDTSLLVNNNDNPEIQQLFVEAERQFAFHPIKEDILAKLRTVLPQVAEYKTFAFGGARAYDTNEEAQKQDAIEDALESFFCREDLLKNLKVFRFGGCILSREKMKHQILEQAEEFIQPITPKENQKDVLYYIRTVAYDRNFLDDPTAFINQWIQDRGSEKIHRFPSDDALSFFKQLQFSGCVATLSCSVVKKKRGPVVTSRFL